MVADIPNISYGFDDKANLTYHQYVSSLYLTFKKLDVYISLI